MLTERLEKLIHSGKAAYKTFVAGGTQKHILNVDNDRYIIITDLTYFSSVNLPRNGIVTDGELERLFLERLNTQVKIFSNKSTNQYLFRNGIAIHNDNARTGYYLTPIGSVKMDCYLIHEEDVSISFSYAGRSAGFAAGNTITENIAFPPPYDYGKTGQAGVLPVRQIGQTGLTYKPMFQGQNLLKTSGGQFDLQFSFPIDNTTNYANLDAPAAYPILQVGYVEILGNPTNLAMSF